LVCKLADFGVSKSLSDEKLAKSLNMNNTLVGTPIFLSPILWAAYIMGGGKTVR
jgi:serine/threonine protein kinase